MRLSYFSLMNMVEIFLKSCVYKFVLGMLLSYFLLFFLYKELLFFNNTFIDCFEIVKCTLQVELCENLF